MVFVGVMGRDSGERCGRRGRWCGGCGGGGGVVDVAVVVEDQDCVGQARQVGVTVGEGTQRNGCEGERGGVGMLRRRSARTRTFSPRSTTFTIDAPTARCVRLQCCAQTTLTSSDRF